MSLLYKIYYVIGKVGVFLKRHDSVTYLQVKVFGSFETGLYLPSSDVDVSITIFI